MLEHRPAVDASNLSCLDLLRKDTHSWLPQQSLHLCRAEQTAVLDSPKLTSMCLCISKIQQPSTSCKHLSDQGAALLGLGTHAWLPLR